MKRYLALLRTPTDHPELRSVLEAKLSPPLVSALLAAGILRPGEIADWHPCQGTCGNSRRIEESFHADAPWVGVCTSPIPFECGEPLFTDDQLATYVSSFERFVAVVRAALRIEGTSLQRQRDFGFTYLLGTVLRGGRETEVFLTLSAAAPEFRFFLKQRTGAARASLVLSTAAPDDVQTELAAEHGPGGHVELAYLQDVLVLENDRLAVRAGWLRDHAAVASVQSGAPHVARVYTDSGPPTLVTAAGVAALVARRDDYDLFIDAMTAVGRKGGVSYAASIRTAVGRLRSVALSENGAAALAELVAAAVPRGAPELAAVKDLAAATEIVERARRALEVKRPWRWFKTRRGFTPEQNTFVFTPEPGKRYAVIAPLQPARVVPARTPRGLTRP